ncbi:hypothetical protein FQZ97_1046670 [compost metagenome]
MALVFGAALGTVATGLQGRLQLVFGHRGLTGKVGSTSAQAQMAHAGQFQLRVNGAQVDHVQAGLQLPRQHTDRRAPADEVT